MNRSRFLQGAVLVVTVAVTVRCLPLLWSPYPFNPDGIGYARRARFVLANGSMPLARMAPDNMSFTAYVVTLADVLGVEPLLVAQPVIAVVGAMPVVLTIAITRRIVRRSGFTHRRARQAALLAGALLAVDGLYLHRSMAVDEQTPGLMLVPVALIAFLRGYSSDRRWYLVGGIALVSLPPLHNLESVVVATGLTLVSVYLLVRDRRLAAVGISVLALASWLYTVGYMEVVAAITPAEVAQAERLASVPGLLLAWLVLGAVALIAWMKLPQWWQRVLGFSTGGIWFGLLLLNAVLPVFPGTPQTPPLLFGLLAPLGGILGVAIVGGTNVVDIGPDGLTIATLFAVPPVLAGFSLTATLTPEYVNTIYRVSTFVHFPVAILAGIGALRLTDYWGGASKRSLGATLAVVLIVCAMISIPVAVSGLELLSYKGVTTPAELSASGFAGERTPTWAGDDHLVRVSSYHREAGGGSKRPTLQWLRGGAPPDCAVLMQKSWTTTGGQFHPAPPARLSHDVYTLAIQERHLVYTTTSPDPISLSVPRGNTTTC